MAQTNPLWEADEGKPVGTPAPAPAQAAPQTAGPANPLWDADAQRQGQAQTQAQEMTGEKLRADLGRSALAGFGRGAVSLAGLPGDIESLVDMAREKITGNKPGERYFPTGEEMVKKAEAAHPMAAEYLGYKPQSTAGKYLRSGAEFIPGTLIGPGGMAAKVVGGLGAGMAMQGAEDFSRSQNLSPGTEAALKIGAAIPAYMLGAKGTSLAAKPFEGVARPGLAGQEKFVSALAQDLVTQGKYGSPAEARAALASGAEMLPAALAGEQTKRLLQQSAAKLGPDATEAYAAAAAKAAENAPKNTMKYIDDIFGAEVNAFDEMQALARRTRDVNSENYTRVMALPEVQSIGGPELTAVMNRVPKSMLNRIVEDMRIGGMMPEDLGLVATKGGYTINPQGMPLRFWDELKQSIDSQMNALKDVSGKVTDTKRYSALNSLNSDLKAQLNKIDPYKSIRDEAVELFGARDWTELGQKYFKMSGTNLDKMRDLEARLAKASPERQMDFAYGLASEYKNLLEAKPDKALAMFSGKEGSFNAQKFMRALSPLGEKAGADLIGRSQAEYLNRNIASIRPSGMFERTVKSQYMPLLGGGAGVLADLLLTPAIWAGKPSAILLSMAGAGLGKLYSMKEARIANKVLEAATNPELYAELGQLLAKDPAARSFLQKTNSFLARGVKYPAGSSPSTNEQSQTQTQDQNQAAQISRPGRASGGRIEGMKTAEMLMRAAHNAKNKISKVSEQILDQPDESVVKALSIAKQHI